MLVLASIADVAGVLTLVVLLVGVLYVIRIRRVLGSLVAGIGDRHIELRIDLKNARAARERHHKELVHWLSRATGDLKQVVNFTATLAEVVKDPDGDRKTIETKPLSLSEAESATKEQPPTVRAAKRQASDAPEGTAPSAGEERASQTEAETIIWSANPAKRTLVGVGIPRASVADAHSEPGALAGKA